MAFTKRFGPGRVRRKLAEMIASTLQEPGLRFWMNPEDLIPNQGYWRIDYRADVMPWTGGINVSTDEGKTWHRWNIQSWATMTELTKDGFDYIFDCGCVELHSHYERPHPAAKAKAR